MRKSSTFFKRALAHLRAFVIMTGVLIMPILAFSQITISSNNTSATVDQSGDPVTVTGSGDLKYSDLNTWLNSGKSVEVQTSGDISVAYDISKTSGGDCYLTLKANGSILFPAKKIISSTSGALSLVFWADADDGGAGSGAIQLYCDITTNGGGVWMGGGDGTALWVPYTGASDLTVGDGPATGTAALNGVNLYPTTTITTGVGNISIYGEYSYGTVGGTGFYSHDGSKINTTSGNVEITGINNNNQYVGVWTRTAITTSSGNISMTGSGHNWEWGGLNSDWGLMLYSSSGNITLDGTNNHPTGPSIRFGNHTNLGEVGMVGYNNSDIFSSTSNVIFRGDRFVLGTSSINTSGTFTIEPTSASFPSAFTWPSNLSLVSTVSGLTIGKDGNTADISLATALDIAGPLSLYGGTVTASSNTTCTNLVVNTGTTLNFDYGSSLITNGTITNNGTINISHFVAIDNKWHLISMPNNSTTANTFLDMYLQSWDEENKEWVDITNAAETLTPVKGYSLWCGDSKGPGTTFTYSGTPNTGNQPISLLYHDNSEQNDGANLVGNPYPSYLDWDEVNGYGTKYTWNGADYDERTEAGTGDGSQYVAPTEGFFVVTGSSGNTFTLTNDMRTHNSAKKEATALSNEVVLSANSQNYSDALYIVFNESANENFELPRDAWKFISGTTGICQIWSQCPDGNLAVDVRPETESIQLGFANNEAGTYSIGIKEIADISTAILEDTKLNIFHDLSEGAYSFDWRLNDDETRFKLHLNTTAVQEINGSAVQAYVAGGNIIIQSKSPAERITLTDITGRTLGVWEHTETIPAPKTAGVYLVTLASGNQMLTKKIIIE